MYKMSTELTELSRMNQIQQQHSPQLFTRTAGCYHTLRFNITKKHSRAKRKQPRQVAVKAMNNGLLEGALNVVLAGGIVGGIAFSALPLLGRKKITLFPEEELTNPGEFDKDYDSIKWSVMGVISLIPVVNWLAWVFGATDDEDAALRYYAYAALYLLPYLKDGIQIDAFIVAITLIGALHLQVERVAKVQSIVDDLKAAKGIADKPKAAARLNAPKSTKVEDLYKFGKRSTDKEPETDELKQELKDWDSRLRQRDKPPRRSASKPKK